jgi:hypothetical protein
VIHEHAIGGLAAVTLENDRLRVTVLAGKGTDVVEFTDKRRDLDFVWRSPNGIRHPVTTSPGAGTDDVAAFLDSYPGGWQEVLPNGGAPSVYRGASFAQHGEVATLPWEYEVVDDGAVRFTVTARRMPLRLAKTVRLRAAALEFDEELVNEAPVPLEAMWGHHITFGAQFGETRGPNRRFRLSPGGEIRVPDGVSVIPHATAIHPSGRRRVMAGGPYAWPTVPDGSGGTVDLSIVPGRGEPSDIVYLAGFGDTGWYEIGGLRVEWDATVLPYLWLWQELGATTDYPWWGQAYVLGLEPFSSYPTDGLAAAVDNGTALRLAPGDRRTLHMAARLLGEA